MGCSVWDQVLGKVAIASCGGSWHREGASYGAEKTCKRRNSQKCRATPENYGLHRTRIIHRKGAPHRYDDIMQWQW